MKEISRIRRIARNSILLTLQQVVVNILSIVVVAYIARKLGTVDYGVFSLAFSFSGILSFLGHLGLRTLTVREVAKDIEHANNYLSKIIPARLFLIALMTVVIPLIAIIINYEIKLINIIAIAALSTMFEQLSRIIADIFQAHEEMGKIALRDIIVRLFTGIASIAILFYGYGLVSVSWIYAFGAFVGFIFNILLYNSRFLWPTLRLDYAFIWRNIKVGLSFTLLGMATSLYTYVDALIISKMLDMQSVGYYNASANLFYRLNFIADAVATASFPAISQLFFTDKQESNNVLTKSISGILIISLPIAFGGWMLSDDIIRTIYGEAYIASVDVFKILICSLPFMFLSVQFFYLFGAIQLQWTVFKIYIFLFIVNFIANILIVPIYGIVGAAYTTLATECIGFAFLIRISSKYFRFSGLLKVIQVTTIPLVIMMTLVHFSSKIGLIFAIIVGALSFTAGIYLTGKDEVCSLFSNIVYKR